MRRKSLWKNLMLATALTVVLGTAPVTAFAADVDSTVTEAEQTAPEADTTVKDEVSTPEAKAITVDVATSSTTFDGTQDIVITYTINGYIEGTPVYEDVPLFDGHTGVLREKVADNVYRFTITKYALQACIERNGATNGQTFVFNSGCSYAEDFPTVTLTYTTGDNGNGETPEKPENPDPDNGNGGNGNGDNNGGDNNGGDNNNGQTPENPDNGNGDNNNGGQAPETPDNGNGQTPETPDNGNSNTNNQNNTQNNTNNNQTTAKPTKTSPKTGDATATLPVAGTGLASLGVALATVLRKRK